MSCFKATFLHCMRQTKKERDAGEANTDEIFCEFVVKTDRPRSHSKVVTQPSKIPLENCPLLQEIGTENIIHLRITAIARSAFLSLH